MSSSKRPAVVISRVLLAGLLAATSAACGGGTEPELDVGSLSFTYSGAESGAFAAVGPLDPNEDLPTSDGAAGVRFGSESLLLVTAVQMRGTANANVIQLALPNITAPRTFNLDDDQCLTSPAAFACPFIFMGIDVPIQSMGGPDVTAPPDGLYIFSTGTITVTAVSATRITGTFQGSAESLDLDLSATPRVVVVTNGTFDVPIRSGED